MSIGAIKDRIFNVFRESPSDGGAPLTSISAIIEDSDPISSINYIDRLVENGQQFASGKLFSSVGTGNSVYILIKTISSIHCIFRLIGTGDAIIRLYEGATVSDNGTSVSIINMHRTSLNTIDTTVFHTPTITTNGTKLDGDALLAGGTDKSSAGSNRDLLSRGLILKPSENYLLELENSSGKNASYQIGLDMHEAEV